MKRKKFGTILAVVIGDDEVRAKFLGLKRNAVALGLADGRTVNYPMAKLSAESQKLARDLAAK